MAFKATGNTPRDGPITAAYSFTGWPAVRAGATSEGMPVGVQIVGRPWRDDVVLAAMQSLEEELGGWQPPAIRESYRFESPDLRDIPSDAPFRLATGRLPSAGSSIAQHSCLVLEPIGVPCRRKCCACIPTAAPPFVWTLPKSSKIGPESGPISSHMSRSTSPGWAGAQTSFVSGCHCLPPFS